MSRYRSHIGTFLLALALGGCMVARKPAPVVQRTPEPVEKPAPAARAADSRPDTYTVKRGDTLYGIALDYGLDYRDLARWNGITNPAAIEVGQVLRLKDSAQAPAPVASAGTPEPAPGAAVVMPYQAPPPVEGKPMGGDAAATPSPLPAEGAATADSGATLVTGPLAVKLPYSQAALAKLQETPPSESSGASAPSGAAASSSSAATQSAPAERTEAAAAAEDTGGITWAWPTRGRIIAGFNENGGPKGVQIAGNLGQAIVASAPGRVVYTGNGLRGYGNLVIIKHNDTYLSAYAHNRTVLVKQGDTVARGQKIAEMGDSDASRPMLHFEIRRQGKPVDPLKLLPPPPG